jgi:hypothetical protein
MYPLTRHIKGHNEGLKSFLTRRRIARVVAVEKFLKGGVFGEIRGIFRAIE